DRLHAEEGAARVDREDGVEFFGGNLGRMAHGVDTGVGDIDVETAEAVGDDVGNLRVVARIRDVACDRKRAGTDSGGRLVEGLRTAACDGDVGAFGGEERRYCETDAAAPARHEGGLAVKNIHAWYSSRAWPGIGLRGAWGMGG